MDIKRINPLKLGSKHDIVALDLINTKLKVAYLKYLPNKKNLVSILHRDVSGLSDAEMSKVIRSCFYELEIRNPYIIDIIPAHSIITKNIEIPSVSPQEIREIINLQAGRHTPYSRDEIIVDYIDIGAYKNNYTKILLLIAVRSVIKRHFDLLEKAGFGLDYVFLSSESLAYTLPRISNTDTSISPVAIVHIDEVSSEFIVVFRAKVLFIRFIGIGAQHLAAERAKYEAKFIEEIKRSLEAYQNEDIDKIPNALVLLGAVEQLRDLGVILNNNLPFPTKIVPYFGSLPVPEDAFRIASLAKSLSFVDVVSPLFSFAEMKVNLIPEEVKLKRALEEKARDLVKMGIFALSVFVLIFFTLLSQIYFKNAYLKKIRSKYAGLNKDAEQLEKDFSRTILVKNYLNNRFHSLEILSELHNITPLDIALSDIRFDEKGKLSVKGIAESMPTVLDFIDNMKKSKYFKEVKRKYAAQRKEGAKDVTDFEVSAFAGKE